MRRRGRPMRRPGQRAAAGCLRSRRADPQPVPARLRPGDPFHRVPPAEAQDPGVCVSRGRPLPHPADPYAGSGADRPLAGPRARPRRGPDRNRWRWPTTSAIRRSAMPASGRSTAASPIGGFDHNAQTLRVVTALEHRYPEFDGLNLTWETLEGIVKHNGPLTDRTAARPGATARAAFPSASRTINRPRSGTVELSPRWRRRRRPSPTTSPTTPTTSTMACAPACSASTISG